MSDLRKSTRYPAALAVTVKSGDRTFEATTRNLSLGGLALELDDRLPVGSHARISFRVPGAADPIDVEVEVRWSDGHELGLQFGGLRAREVWELNRYFGTLAR